MSSLNCLAINPQWHEEYFLSFPLGLATIVAIVKNLGHNVQVVDFDAERIENTQKTELFTRIMPKPDIVLLTGMITNYKRIYELSKIVRSIIPDAVLVLGGSLATTAPDSILKKLDIDVFVLGEGDKTIEVLLKALQSKTPLRSVPSIKVKEGNNIFFTSYSSSPDIAEIPRPCYELFPMQFYTNFNEISGNSFDMYTSKGCPSSCVYCYRISGNRIRYRPVDEVIEEIEFVKDAYKTNSFSFVDDNFAINKKWIRTFCKKAHKINIKFRFQAFISALDENTLDDLQEAGLFGVSIGMESGSPDILNEMNKRIDIHKAEKLIDSFRKRDIKYNATFIIGMPGENDKTIEMTKRFLINNGFTTNYQLFFATPYPGTKLYADCLEKKLIQDEIEYIENLRLQDSININLTKFPNWKLAEWREYILNEVSPPKYAGSSWKSGAI